MKKKSDVFITVDRHNQEVEELLWWIEEENEPDDDSFSMDELEAIIEGSGEVNVDDQYKLGRLAYNTYCEKVGWKSVITRTDLPQFVDTLPIIKSAWIAAAVAVAEKIRETN